MAKTEAHFSKLSPVSSSKIRNVSTDVAEVGKAVKEAISAQNNKQSVIVSGVVESGRVLILIWLLLKNFLVFWVKTA